MMSIKITQTQQTSAHTELQGAATWRI